MKSPPGPVYVTSRSLRRAARAARALAGDEFAADLLVSSLAAGNREIVGRRDRSAGDFLTSVRAASEHA